MTRTSKIARRKFLGGAAVALGLPWLESMPARAQADRKRLVTLFLPNGVWLPNWVPTTTGPDYTLSPTLQPLAKVKSKVLVLSGLQNNPCNDSAGAHNYGPAGMLTCRLATKGATISVGVSMDQVVAKTLAGATRIQSMQLGLTDQGAGVDNGYAAIYQKVISWASPTQPLAANIKPEVVFDQIFAGFDPGATDAERAKRRALRTSVLDYTLNQSRALSARVAQVDRLKLDEYTTGLRELERQIKSATDGAAACSTGVARPAGNLAMPERVRMMMDLIVLAFQCDATRVISFMLGCGGNGALSFGFLGIPENHHPISHHKKQPEAVEKLKKIDLWEVTQIAYLLEKMDAINEGGATMLDKSVVLTSSEIADGDAHNQNDKPFLVAGRGGSTLPSGRHIRYNGDSQANLMITLMNLFGANQTTFGAQGVKPLSI